MLLSHGSYNGNRSIVVFVEQLQKAIVAKDFLVDISYH